ncbi:universal stress protein [Geopsychrobacter electrodiphilus]|uniref:universal stress protein n=1 Tax=Geopsychrobacter electrodiphilus TaxID=225196 RepID=UPI00035ED858|nr:universal stress protein [Geopsychrobacter electrodiphilus]
MNEMTTILFATDFSEVSDSAFEYAASLATTYNARLVVLHVVAHQTDLRSFYVPHISFDDIDRQVEVGAKQRMSEFCVRWQGQFPDLIARVVTGIPQEEILKQAQEVTASVIVMGTHGRQGFEHFIFGSTAESVVKTAPCPVLTVRPQS